MRYVITLIITVVFLSACGGSSHETSSASAEKQWQESGVIYSYPAHGQSNVSVKTPVVLRFSDPVDEAVSGEDVKLSCQGDACDEVAWASYSLVDNNKGLVLTPAQPLTPNQTYCLAATGNVNLPSELCFETTLATTSGSLLERGADNEFSLLATFPDMMGNQEPVVDFSNFRLRFSQPLDSRAIEYGKEVALSTAEGELVDATLLVKQHLITVAPKASLKAGEEYVLTLDQLPSRFGGTLSESLSFTPQDTQPRSILVQDTVKASEAETPCAVEADPKTSPLTGGALNCVPLQSVLLGEDDATMQQGDIFAELAYLPKFPKVSPLRIPRGSLLTGTTIDVKIAGAVEAATDGSMSTGDVSVSFISDAVGYIYPNPYSSASDAPRQVRLFMDVAMTAENPKPNGALSQDLLHVELVGMASLDGKQLEIDAVGIVEPEVLGAEVAFGLLSFQMKSYKAADQEMRISQARTTGIKPELQSVYPLVKKGEKANAIKPSDAITFNYNAPLDPTSVVPGHSVFITENGTDITHEVKVHVDGASIVLTPNTPWKSDAAYAVELTEQVTGLPVPTMKKSGGIEEGVHYFFVDETDPQAQGQPIERVEHEFKTPVFHEEGLAYAGHVEASEAPSIFKNPVVLTAYPGFPCAMTWNDEGGVCLGDEGKNNPPLMLPRQKVPANRHLRLTFSKPMQTLPEGAFRVEDEAGNTVEGELVQTATTLEFIPHKPWQDGKRYRYYLHSGDCANGPCSVTEQPLITAPLKGVSAEARADMVVEFEGAPASNNVLLSLRNTPTADTAAALTYYEAMNSHVEALLAAEKPIPNSTKLEVDGWGGVLTQARVGCASGDCPAQSFIHLVGNLDVEIFGKAQYVCPYVDNEGNPEEAYCTKNAEGEEALAVGIYPSAIMVGSADVFAEATALIKLPAPTGAQVMRMHPGPKFPAQDEKYGLGNNPLFQDNPNGLIPGWIRSTKDGPVFETRVNLYMDAPNLEVPLNGKHNLQNYPLALNLRGAVEFSEDGRMHIHQMNLNSQGITVKLSELLGLIGSDIKLKIPEAGAYLTYESEPVK